MLVLFNSVPACTQSSGWGASFALVTLSVVCCILLDQIWLAKLLRMSL